MRFILTAGLAALLLTAPATAKKPPSEMERLSVRAAHVTITRDRLGVAHIKAATDADAVFGMAYAQAEDDWNRVETNYLTALGRLSEAEGEKAVWSDLRQRLWIDDEKMQRLYLQAPAWLQAVCKGWADGLNYYVALHPGAPRALHRFEPWMALAFSEGSIGGDIEYAGLDGLKALYGQGAAKVAERPTAGEPQGSNGIALAPSRTRNGNALLLINPHTSFFFRDLVQVQSAEGLDVYGAVTWGQPFVYQGFNRDIGWMHTSSGLDNRDEFAETLVRMPGGKLGMKYGDGTRPIEERAVTIRVRQADGSVAERRFTTLHSLHGPIVRSEGGKFIAYAILDDPLGALEQSFLRTKAHNLDDFLKVSARRANSSNNTIFAGRDGTIAYLHPQFVPLRDERVDYRWTVDGSNPKNDWRGLYTLDGLPMVRDPKSGFVYNSNDAPWNAAGKGTFAGRHFPAYMDQWGSRARSVHALQLLDNSRTFTPESLIATAYDPAQPGFDRILPPLFAAFDAMPARDPRRAALSAPVALLRGWDRHWAKDSEAQTLAVHYGEAIWDRVMTGVRTTTDEETAYARIAEADGTARLAALEAAVGKLTTLYGGWRVQWGDINRYQRNDGAIVQTFDDSRPSIAVGFPSARWGSLASFGARTYPGTVKRYGTNGNSFVAVVEFAKDGPRAWAVTAGGVNGDPASPHFSDQAQAYADGRLLPVPLTAAEIAAQAVETYSPGNPRKTR